MSNKPIYFDRVFERHYQKRILKEKKLHELFKEAFSVFLDNPNNPLLKGHDLKGAMSSKKAFFVDNDCPVIYVEDKDKVLFLDIGNHKEVYK